MDLWRYDKPFLFLIHFIHCWNPNLRAWRAHVTQHRFEKFKASASLLLSSQEMWTVSKMRTFSRLSFFALGLIQFVRPARSTIIFAAADGTVLTTFDNADIGSQSYSITGPVALASFNPTNVSNCTMQPVPPGTAVLLIPFDDGLVHDYPPAEYGREPLNGCRFYDQIVENAGWFVSNSNSTHPLIAVFQSARTGDALGLVEMGVNNEDLLSKSSVLLTLTHSQDFEVMMTLVNKTAVAYVTAGKLSFFFLFSCAQCR